MKTYYHSLHIYVQPSEIGMQENQIKVQTNKFYVLSLNKISPRMQSWAAIRTS